MHKSVDGTYRIFKSRIPADTSLNEIEFTASAVTLLPHTQ